MRASSALPSTSAAPTRTTAGSSPSGSRDSTPSRLDYEDLEVEDFRRQMDQRRQDQLDFFAERRGDYALSPGFVDYAKAYVDYEWAEEMISYPERYRAVNGRYNEEIPPDYFDFLQEVPLVDENALGVRDYRRFLDRTLYWESNEGFKPKLPRLSEMYDLFDSGSLRIRSGPGSTPCTEKDGWRPDLSKKVDLSSLGLSDSVQTRLDSLYDREGRHLDLSEMFDLSSLGLSDADQAHVDSLYRKGGYSISSSSDAEDAESGYDGRKDHVSHAPRSADRLPEDGAAQAVRESRPVGPGAFRSRPGPDRFPVREPPTARAVREDRPFEPGVVGRGPDATRLALCRPGIADLVAALEDIRSGQGETGRERCSTGTWPAS